ncbi:MAG: hypothetical protein IKE55_03115, partial [Kiritimatiellae bacterium]|nr:hypothetical protein [Kiritimatiellia bacterium]
MATRLWTSLVLALADGSPFEELDEEWSERSYDDLLRLRTVSYSDGTSETNAYSCCRLLWRRDREGRKVLRSAQTGTDSLYYAEEDVWITNVTAATNHEPPTTNHGFRVTQHFYDAFGRETNTVVYAGATPGEATVASASDGKTCTTVTTVYPYGGSNYAVSTDERGKVTVRSTDITDYSHTETAEATSTNGVVVLTTKHRSYLGGGYSTRREWPVGRDDPIAPFTWTEERHFEDYAADGSRIEYVVTDSYDDGTVTNSVSTYDLLGRLVTSAVPCVATTPSSSSFATATYTYDGASSRILATTYTAGDIIRTTTYLYNNFGEQVGTVLDGVTRRDDTTYETDSSNIVWRVESSSVVGPSTNSLIITHTQLTGLSGSCRRRTVTLVGRVVPNAPQTVTETVATFDPDTSIETETTTSSVAPSIVRQSLYGLVLTNETSGVTTVNAYDAFGRIAATSRSVGSAAFLPLQSFDYAPCGDLVTTHAYTNATDYATETYDYDMLGNRVATADALGNTIYRTYDPFGNVIAEDGTTYPVRYTYDSANRRTSLSTTRDGVTWDTTTWTYDAATGNCLSKTYADNSTVTYTYTPDNLPLRTTYASGRWKENVYDERRQVVG